jgi:hypothetical protein
MVAAYAEKKWLFFSAWMIWTALDSAKRHCSLPLCGKEAVKFRWGSVACSGRSGRGERCLFWWYCCAFAVLNIGMGVLPRQVQATVLASNGLAARTGTPFWRWMPLPMQICNPGCALDRNHPRPLLERRVIISCGHCVLWCPPIDEMSIVNPGRRQSTYNDLWAPDPGREQAIDFLHQSRPSSSKSTVMIAGDSVQTQHNPEAMQSFGNGMQGENYLDRPRKEDRMLSNGRNASNGTISMSKGQIDWRGLWVPFNSQQSTGLMDERGLWVSYYTASPAMISARSGNEDRHAARKQHRLDVPWAKISTMGPASRNNQGNDKRSSGDGNADNLNKIESTILDDGNDHDESLLYGGDSSGSSITLKDGDDCDSGRSHNSAVDTLLGGKNVGTGTSLDDGIICHKTSNNDAILLKTGNNLGGTGFMPNTDVSTLSPVETEDKPAATNLSDGVCATLSYREALGGNSNGGEEFKCSGLKALELLPPTIPGGIDISEAHIALGLSVRGPGVVVEQLANFGYEWRQVCHGVGCVPPSSSVMKLGHSDVCLLLWDPNAQSIEVLEELMPLDVSGTVTDWLLSKMPVLVPDYTLPITIRLVLDSLLAQQVIDPHGIPPSNMLLLTLEGTVVDENTLGGINKELKKRSHGDSLGGSGSQGDANASGSIPTMQVVERNTEAGAASTSEPSLSTEGDGKELTGGGKRGKKGGNKSEAAGDASGGRVS